MSLPILQFMHYVEGFVKRLFHKVQKSIVSSKLGPIARYIIIMYFRYVIV